MMEVHYTICTPNVEVHGRSECTSRSMARCWRLVRREGQMSWACSESEGNDSQHNRGGEHWGERSRDSTARKLLNDVKERTWLSLN